MKKSILIMICLVAILTTGCTDKKEQKNAETVAKNIAIASVLGDSLKVRTQKEKLKTYNAELKYIQNVEVKPKYIKRLKEYNLDATNKKKCSITHYIYNNKENFIGYCK